MTDVNHELSNGRKVLVMVALIFIILAHGDMVIIPAAESMYGHFPIRVWESLILFFPGLL